MCVMNLTAYSKMDSFFQNIAILLITCFPICIYAYPNGLVTSSCATMMPGHGAQAQTSTSPYILSLAKTTYSPGENIAVTLTSNDTTQFKGFLIQARSGSDSTPVGSFQINTTTAQTLTCTSAASSVSHTANSEKTSIQVIWVAPNSNIADIQIRATVVQVQKIFWTNVASSKILYVATPNTVTSSSNSGFQLPTRTFQEFLLFCAVVVTFILG